MAADLQKMNKESLCPYIGSYTALQ